MAIGGHLNPNHLCHCLYSCCCYRDYDYSAGITVMVAVQRLLHDALALGQPLDSVNCDIGDDCCFVAEIVNVVVVVVSPVVTDAADGYEDDAVASTADYVGVDDGDCDDGVDVNVNDASDDQCPDYFHCWRNDV